MSVLRCVPQAISRRMGFISSSSQKLKRQFSPIIQSNQMFTRLITSETGGAATSYKFVDKIQIEVTGGKGGNGCVSYEVLGPSSKRPSGGSGGKGGDVYIIGDAEINSLNFRTFHFNAEHGHHGGSNAMTGRNGKDLYIRVPLGTTVTQRISDEMYFAAAAMDSDEFDESLLNPATESIDDLNTVLLVAEGGRPGPGNKVIATKSKGAKVKSMPLTKIPGHAGETRTLLLEMKVIADVGLVGFPNAGKSSLLTVLSKARPKIAAYPFTTLHPSLGIVEYSDAERVVVADIPGLIKGAHENRGLGHEFLKHIERTKVLLYVIDTAGTEKRDPVEDLQTLIEELKEYDEELLERPSLVFANKFDLKVGKVAVRRLKALAEKHGMQVICGSAESMEGVGELANTLRKVVEDYKEKQRLRLLEEEAEAKAAKEAWAAERAQNNNKKNTVI